MDTDDVTKSDGGSGVSPSLELRYPSVPARPENLPMLRHDLAEWAQRCGLAARHVEAVALATYEALANVAAHAYPTGTGVLDVDAVYRTSPARVEITVTDYGQWSAPPEKRGEAGGRGLVLIRALADHTEVTPGDSGTTVRMTWILESHAPAAG
jgi:anti-sigma regulatory factor (Ser/Thr protein kinase)